MTHQILNADLLEWLKEYNGPRFHGVMSDPPYALISVAKRFGKKGSAPAQEGSDGRFTRLSSGFMGQKWDSFVDLDHFEDWVAEWANSMMRVLYPGAVCMFFGGTRTYHRLTRGLERGGFEIIDCLMWLYGCLDESSEILTSNGWKKGIDLSGDEIVAQWNHSTEQITLTEIDEVIIKPYEGPMILLENDNTSQLLTPNHRIYWRPAIRKQERYIRTSQIQAGWSVKYAGAIPTYERFKLPLAGYHNGLGLADSYASLLAWVWTEGGFDNAGTGVRIYQSSVNPENVVEIDGLLNNLVPSHKRYSRTRVYRGREYEEITWYFSGEFANKIRDDLPDKSPTWELLWKMSLQDKIAFYEAAMKGDGSGMAFYQKSAADREWFQVLLHNIGMQGRDDPKGFSVACHNNPTTELQARHTTKAIGYKGLVWCVGVPNGAFVARRNGRIFITGNSGFPKSHDISKGMDKAAGAEREKVDGGKGPAYQRSAGNVRPWMFEEDHKIDGPNAVTEAAKQWDGYGTALKPAWEPVILCRAPRGSMTFADLAKTYGTGALNIDGSRIEYKNESLDFSRTQDGNIYGGHETYGKATQKHTTPLFKSSGRWPANLILSHHEDCVKIGEFEVEGRTINRWKEGMKPFGDAAGEQFENEKLPPEIVERWACVADCPIRALDDQAGNRLGSHDQKPTHSANVKFYGGGRNKGVGYADAGGPSRFFYTGKASRREKDKGCEHLYWARKDGEMILISEEDWQSLPKKERAKGNIHPSVKPLDLIRYLEKLFKPPDIVKSRLLVPFSGSGSEVIAALQVGWNEVVGIEIDENYCMIAEARIAGTLGMF